MSWLLDISGMMESSYPESQGFEDDDDDDGNDGKFIYPCHSTRPPPHCKSHDNSGDSQVNDLGEPIPFSLNPRHCYMVKGKEEENKIYAKKLDKHALELENKAQNFQEPFYKDVEMPGILFKDEHEVQTASMALSGHDPFQHSKGKNLGKDAFAPWACASYSYLGYQEPTRGAEPHVLLHKEAVWDREFPSQQLTYDMLREENAMLRSVARSLQSYLESHVQRLERQLMASLAKKEREIQELQSFVHETEWNLQLTNQRALEAESNVEKLKQEIFILQGELERYKVENENLRASQTINLGALKYNIDFALQNLRNIIVNANWSIRQLASGAESLHFVAEVLNSTGKIFEVEAEKET